MKHLVVMNLQEQFDHHDMLHGYKFMPSICIQSGLVVTQKTRQHLQKIQNPGGVQLRQQTHVDSFDKLKPFGISINGSVDEFSRVSRTIK